MSAGQPVEKRRGVIRSNWPSLIQIGKSRPLIAPAITIEDKQGICTTQRDTLWGNNAAVYQRRKKFEDLTFWHAWRVAPHTRETPIKFGALALAAATLAQAGLGILTLIAHAPLPLALAHQAGAAALFALAVWHLQLLRGGG